MTGKRFAIGMLLFPRLTQLDMTGPFEVFKRIIDEEFERKQ